MMKPTGPLSILVATLSSAGIAAAKSHWNKCQHRFGGQGDYLVALCGNVWFNNCSILYMEDCFAVKDRKITPLIKSNHGFDDVNECIFDSRTGEGVCTVWPNGKKEDEYKTNIDASPNNVYVSGQMLYCSDGGKHKDLMGLQLGPVACDHLLVEDDWSGDDDDDFDGGSGMGDGSDGDDGDGDAPPKVKRRIA
ncbi:hypothetical protein MKZ38_008748 [Zalerion maritima]|uniref:Cyanovirin-N domain-containing protein n=1 Tax=Zalerion maritima TaxID=339359 RepID=A0AAD5WMK0_9PEZI|nr:hypothetical protein MKZ38_008748 [Zalerion maritima]